MLTRSDEDELELRHYFQVIWRRKAILIVTILVFVALSVGYDFLAKPTYRASTDLLLQSNLAEQITASALPTGDPSQLDKTRIATEIEVMQSKSVESAAEQQLGHQVNVSVAQVGDSEVVTISATSKDADQAAKDAQTYAQTYISTRKQQIDQGYVDAATSFQTQIDALNKQRSDLTAPLTDLENQLNTAAGARRDQIQAQIDALNKQISDPASKLDSQIQTAQTSLNTVNSARATATTGGAQNISAAEAPKKPVSPDPVRNALLAVFGALVVGLALAFIVDHADDTIKGKEDLEVATHGLPTLGLIPSVSGWRDSNAPVLATVVAPDSPAAEAYRTLRTSLQFIALERTATVVLFTSPALGDGKTTTVSNVGVALARAGQRVIIVDCDLRRPRVHRFFGLDNETGFTSVLLRDLVLADAVKRVEGEPRLAVLPSGPPPPNPSEMLSSKRAVEIINALREEADFVLVDAPPLLPVSDAIVLASRADAVVLVASAGQSTAGVVRRAVELLSQVEAPLVGTALNRADAEDVYGYRYGYRYGGYNYGANAGRHRRRHRWWPFGRRVQAEEPPIPTTAKQTTNGSSPEGESVSTKV